MKHQQDRLLVETIREIEEAMEAAHKAGNGFTWSWVAKRGGISPSTLNNWRKRNTRSGLTRTMNAALQAVGKKLYIGDIKR